MEQRAYYAIIPANVRYDRDLPASAKLFYGEITALCNERGYCWATNQYFADLYDSNIRTVQRWIKALEEKGYIKVYLEQGDAVKQTRRYIYLAETAPCHDDKTKMSGAHNKNVMPSHDENVTHNNTLSFNTTVNKKDVVGVGTCARACANTSRKNTHSMDTDSELGQVVRAFSDNIHPVSGDIELGVLDDLLQHYGLKWMLEAIKEAVLHHGNSVKYIKSILERWERCGFQSVPDKNANAFSQGKTNNKQSSWSSTVDDMADEAIRRIREKKENEQSGD